MTIFHEPPRSIPVAASTDVLVCGGGPAGVAAALAAARRGAKVTLIESQGCLGGVWTSGLLSYIIDGDSQKGFVRELIEGIARRDGAFPLQDAASDRRPGIYYSAETVKIVLEDLCADAGVTVRLYTRVTAAALTGDRQLSVVLTESKTGREAWEAKVFIDCTGDGDLASQAGCSFEIGRPSDGKTQPMSLMCLVTGIRYEDVAHFVTGGKQDHIKGKELLLGELRRADYEPSYAKPTLFHLRDELYALMANHEYGESGISADELTAATMHARRDVYEVIQALRRLGGVWRSLELVATAAHIGVRESRRIHGLYTVTKEDIIEGTRHPDAVSRVYFPVDIHALSPEDGKAYHSGGVKAKPYDVPYRALVARDVDGLLLAGRCISGDFFAHASYRVTGYACEFGEAAGIAAAWCVKHRILPHAVNWVEVAAQDSVLVASFKS